MASVLGVGCRLKVREAGLRKSCERNQHRNDRAASQARSTGAAHFLV